MLVVLVYAGVATALLTDVREDRLGLLAEWRKTRNGPKPGFEVDWPDVAISSLLAGGLLVPLLPSLPKSGPLAEQILLCFQSGFFWEAITLRVRRRSRS